MRQSSGVRGDRADGFVQATFDREWWTYHAGANVATIFQMIVRDYPRKRSTKPRRKAQRRTCSREESYPENLLDHLMAHVPGFGEQPPEVRHALAYLVWIAGTGKRRHNTFAGCTTIWHRDLERLFGRGVFSRVNTVLRIFEVIEPLDKSKGGSTRAYRLMPAVAEVVADYLSAPNIELTHLTRADGVRIKTPPRAVASKDSDGHSQTVWRDAEVVNVVPVNLARLYAMRECLMRELDESKAATDLSFPGTVESKQYRLDMLNRLLRLANTHAAGAGKVMMRYVVCSTGRLFGAGVNLQNIPREIRNAALHGLWDYDIANCHFAIFQQMAARCDFETPAITNYLANKEAIRRGIAERVGITYEEVKECLLATLYGARHSPWKDASIPQILGGEKASRFYLDPDVAALAGDIKEGRRVIVSAHSNEKRLINAVGLSIDSSASPKKRLAHLLQGIEVQALRAVQARYPEEMALLIHDGFVSTVRLDIKRLEDIIRDATGYDLRISEKRIGEEAATVESVNERGSEEDARTQQGGREGGRTQPPLGHTCAPEY